MSAGIRLDAIPITGLPQIAKSDSVEPYLARINCVLHSDHLPTHQCLEVSVNGVVQPSVSEGDQIVFTWQLVKALDEVHIKLLNRGVVMKHWQGCWNERDAILHMGTLPVQVFFDGKLQPLVTAIGGITSAATLAAMQPVAEEVNGGNGHPIVLSESGHGTHEASEPTDEKPQSSGVIVVQDLLVMAEARPSSTAPLTDDSRAEEEPEVGREDEEEAGEMEEEELVVDEEEASEMEEEEVGSFEESERFDVQQDPQSADGVTVTGPRIAAFHVGSIEALQGLMATMPTNTIIIDLRRHSRTKKRPQGQGELSKEHLRNAFGGRYWDRGWAIETKYQSESSSKGRLSRWRQVLVEPANQPDGIPSLVEHLQGGYSMVVMDSRASYVESPRRAVIEELQKQLSNLVIGPIG